MSEETLKAKKIQRTRRLVYECGGPEDVVDMNRKTGGTIMKGPDSSVGAESAEGAELSLIHI